MIMKLSIRMMKKAVAMTLDKKLLSSYAAVFLGFTLLTNLITVYEVRGEMVSHGGKNL